MNVLILLVGMSPAVVTETIWALSEAVPANAKFLPDHIVVITTLKGRRVLEAKLFNDSPANFPMERLIQQLELKIDCKAPSETFEILCPEDEYSVSDDDAHEADELDRMGNLIFSTVRRFTLHEDTRICLSISGGRKSMSHLAGTTMSLLARPQDFLVHVIVEPTELERCPEFFFPEVNSYQPKNLPGQHEKLAPIEIESYEITDEDGETRRMLGWKNGKGVVVNPVHLSRIPFVRLRPLKGVQSMVSRWADAGLSAVIDASTADLNRDSIPTIIYKRSEGSVYFGKLSLEDVKGQAEANIEKAKKILNSPIMQIALLRLLFKHKELPKHFTETLFREFVETCSEIEVNRKQGQNPLKWWNLLSTGFKPKTVGVSPDFPGTFNSKTDLSSTHYYQYMARVRPDVHDDERITTGYILSNDHISRLNTSIRHLIGVDEFSILCIRPKSLTTAYRPPESIIFKEVS
jgi:CRISPR-associated protein (TIGR02584 family)